MYFLGLDVGVRKTHALICDQSGQVLGFGIADGGNQEAVGYEGLTCAKQLAIDQAKQAAGIALSDIEGAGFGIAGYEKPHQYPEILTAINRLGLRGKLVI